MIANVLRTLRHAARALRRTPALSATAILTLAVGIASPTAMFSVATGILGEPPFEDAHELVEIEVDDLPAGRTNLGATPGDLDVWRSSQTAFEDIAGVDRRVFQIGGDGPRPERIRGAAITPNAFDILGAAAAVGRRLVPADATAGAPPVAVLGHRVWEDRYDLDPDVVGRTLTIDGETRTVVGVMGEGFAFPRTEHLWIPLGPRPAATMQTEAQPRFSTFGRLREGVTREAAAAAMERLGANLAAARPGTHRDLTISVHGLAHAELGDGEAALMLYAMTLILSFILVVACVNVAHLLLAHAIARSRDHAVRLALGASRAHVLGGVLAESLLLSLAGGAAGVALAYATVGWLDARLAPVISLFWARIEVDAAVLLFVLILVALSAVLAGFLPARHTGSVHLIDAIKERRGGARRGLRSGRAARVLIGVQIAFSCGLLILSGLMVRGILGLANRDLAFEPDDVLAGRIELRAFDYPDAADRLAFVADLEATLSRAPGVEGLTIATSLPGLGSELRQVELETAPDTRIPEVGVVAVTPGYFETFRARLVDGRAFGEAERDPDRAGVAVVTDVFAERWIRDGLVVGRRFRFVDDRAASGAGGPAWIEIVGMMRDGGVFLEGETARPGIVIPYAQETPASFAVALRAADPASAAALFRDEVRTLDPELPVFGVSTLRAALGDASVVQRTFGALFGVFGLVALLMAVVGLYAVVDYGVKRRAHEVGMRRALGARSTDIVTLLMRGATVPLSLGLAAGTGLALLIAPALGAALFGISPRDPLVYGVVIAILSIAALTAALLPSISAARIDPMRALRAE